MTERPREIWKYALPVEGHVELRMPVGAEVLTVQSDELGILMWALVEVDAQQETRSFRVLGTGNPITGPVGRYIGTTRTNHGRFVWHVFEEPS